MVHYPNGSFPSSASIRQFDLVYQELFVKSTAITGGANAWLFYTSTSIRSLPANSTFSKIQLIAVTDYRLRLPETMVCSTKANVTAIVAMLYYPTTIAQEVECNSHFWIVRLCDNGRPTLCVDCNDPCNNTQCNVLNPYYVSPQGSESSCTSERNIVRNLLITYDDNSQPNLFVSATIIPTKTTASVNVVVSQRSTMQCAAFASGVVPSTLGMITRQYFYTNILSTSLTVLITGLTADTEYDIFCVTTNAYGISMSLQDSINAKMSVKTLCCSKSITISLPSTNYFYAGQYGLNALELTLNESPIDYIDVVVGAYVNSSFPLLGYTTVRFTNPGALIGYISVPTMWTEIVGTVYLNVTYLSSTADLSKRFEIDYFDSTNTFTVIPEGSQPPVPQAKSAVFSSDGSYILFTYTEPTDEGGSSSSIISCGLLFNISNAASYYCVWSSTALLKMYLPTTSDLMVGDNISYIGQVRAACDYRATCSTWRVSNKTELKIQPPSGTYLPVVVVLTVPSNLDVKDTFIFDFSASTGSGGRLWTYISVNISSTFAAEDTIAETYFADHINGSQVSYPANFFDVGKYTFTLTLCNFLSICSASAIVVTTVNISSPSVVLYGTSSRTTTLDHTLTLYAGVTSMQGINNLVITWTMSENGGTAKIISGTSLSPYSFVQSAYTLTVNSIYTITISVVDTTTLLATSASVDVYVESGNIVALIAGGVSQYMHKLTSLTLDGSISYDSNINPSLNRLSGLQMLWTCKSDPEIVVNQCNLQYGSSNSSTLTVYAPALAENSTNRFILTVYDSTRSSSVYVDVSVVSVTTPLVGITTSLTGSKYNVNQKLTIQGYIDSMYPGIARWSLNDSAVALSTAASTNTTLIISQTVIDQSISKAFDFNLVIPANVLPNGIGLSFQLNFVTSNGLFTYGSNLAVLMNDNPRPGLFIIFPLTGSAYSTEFTLVASQWDDPDLPLTYSFGFNSPDGSGLMSLRSQSEDTNAKSQLPSGLDTNNYQLTCVLTVYDGLGAVTTADSSVVVNAVSDAALNSFITSFLSNWTTSADPIATIQPGLLTSLPTLNTATCSGAPNCTLLNRKNCLLTKNTCGACLTSAFIGDAGDANTLCYDLSSLSFRRMRNRLLLESNIPSIYCQSNSDCHSWQTCDLSTSICRAPSKTCTNNCNSQGICQFYTIDTNELLNNCTIENALCTAKCSCYNGFAGSDCSYSTTSLTTKQKLRYSLLVGLFNMTQGMDVTVSNVQTWSTTLSSIVQQTDEVGVNMLSLLNSVASLILSSAVTLNMDVSLVSSVLSTINVIATLESNYSTSGVTFKEESLLKQFNNLLLTSVTYGEAAVTYTYSQFRIKVAAISLNSLSTALYTTQLTSLESYDQIPAFDVTTQASPNSSFVLASLTLMLPKYYKAHSTSTWQQSYRLLTQIYDYSTVSTVQVNLYNAAPISYANVSTAPETFSVFCNYNTEDHVRSCVTSSDSFNLQCTSTFYGWINASCSYKTILPACGRVVSGAVVDDICRVISYSNLTTQCDCSLNKLTTTASTTTSSSSSSSYDGSLQFIAFANVTNHAATVVAVEVVLSPTRAPSQSPGFSGVLYLSTGLTGPSLALTLFAFVLVIVMCLLLSCAYAVMSNRKQPFFNEYASEQRQELYSYSQPTPNYEDLPPEWYPDGTNSFE